MINMFACLLALFTVCQSLKHHYISGGTKSSRFCVDVKVESTQPEILNLSPQNVSRVYKPKSAVRPVEAQMRPGSGAPHVLLSPQFLIRYKVPKVKSTLKAQLEELQSIYKGNDMSGPRSYSKSSSDSYSNDFIKFDPVSPSSNFKKGAKGKTKDDRKDGDKNKSSSENRRYQQSNDDYNDDNEDGGDNEDYYGDEEGGVSLASVPADQLREMEADGFSLEEIQMSLYGEYGLKVSIQAIKKRLFEDRSERKGKVRTGKTRRERQKARNNRLNPKDEKIRLPAETSISIISLAEISSVGGGEIVKYLMLNKGIMSSMNQKIEMSIAKEILDAFGKTYVENGQEVEEDEEEEESPEVLKLKIIPGGLPRAPVVTIMGHVDHGKTTLLDTIRKTQVALGEAGGITQGISAFKVKTSNDKTITFLDTPGHAAFSEMRKRGANITDIVVLVVAADDGVMEQTVECILAAQAAGCPIVVAVNKIDKEGANPQKVLEDLMKYNVVVEEFGGDSQSAKISAKKGLGVEELLESVLLQADIMNLASRPDPEASGTVIEASIDKRQGVIATCLVQHGELKVGDLVVAGSNWGKVKRMLSDQGKELKEAGPSTPVQILGFSSVPMAGDKFTVVKNEDDAKTLAEARARLSRQAAGMMSSASLMATASGLIDGKFDAREIIKIPIVLKCDVTGSIEALTTAIDNLQVSDDESICKIDIVSSSVGDVSFSDVAIAQAAKAKIVAFNVGPGQTVSDAARSANVQIDFFNVVYDALDSLEATVKSVFAPPPPGLLLGRAEIKKMFKLGKVGSVAGCTVNEGLIKQDSKIRILRGKRNQIYIGSLDSLRVGKEVVSEVPGGSDCGMNFKDFQDFEEGDIVECFENS